MAMEDASVLIHLNMSFNPFRSSPSSHAHHHSTASPPPSNQQHQQHQQQRRIYDPDNDSWHTNAPIHSYNQNISNNGPAPPPSSPKRSSSALASFLGWATSSSTATTASTSASRHAASPAATAAIIIQDDHASARSTNNHSASHNHNMHPASTSTNQHHTPLKAQMSPAKSIIMSRGMVSPEAQELHQAIHTDFQMNGIDIPAPPLHDKIMGEHLPASASAPVSSSGQYQYDVHNDVPNVNVRVEQNNVEQNNGLKILAPLRRFSGVENSTNNNNATDTSPSSGSVYEHSPLPPYPKPVMKAPETRSMRSFSQEKNDDEPEPEPLLQEFPTAAPEELLQDFPTAATPEAKGTSSSAATTAPVTASVNSEIFPRTSPIATAPAIVSNNATTPSHPKPNNTQLQSPAISIKQHKQIIHDKEESTFPGFAMFQTAKAHCSLGNLDQALDTTADCLAFQTSSLNGLEGSSMAKGNASIRLDKNPAAAAAAAAVNSSPGNVVVDNNIIDVGTTTAITTSTMMPLDLRTSLLTGVGNALSHLKADGAKKGQQHQHPHQSHPMLSNSIANMISQYPSHPCIAQTLLLRGHLLSECAKREDDDVTILLQAVQNVEMAIALQRKMGLAADKHDELAPPLLFLGNLRTKLGHYNEAEMAYEEAVAILRDVRSCAKMYHHDAMDRREKQGIIDEEVILDCASNLKRVTREIATALYLHGKLYHCQRMHRQAFECYNKALNLFKKGGGCSSQVSRNNSTSLGVKRIVRCMKSRYALEKLVSAYWDDPCMI